MNQGDLLLEDNHEGSTPLDLLLNAISGGNQYTFSENGPGDLTTEESLGGLLASDSFLTREDEEAPEAADRSRGEQANGLGPSVNAEGIDPTLSGRRPNMTDILRRKDELFSTIEVWHPRTGQKSYGKERRMLNPPPVLRVTGPLFPLVTTVTLTSVPLPMLRPGKAIENTSTPMSSQTHYIPLNPEINPEQPFNPYSHRNRRALKVEERQRLHDTAIRSGFGASLPHLRRRADDRERTVLGDGLSFPGLWVGDEVGKGKEFRLDLKLGQPGVDVIKHYEALPIQGGAFKQDQNQSNAQPKIQPLALTDHIMHEETTMPIAEVLEIPDTLNGMAQPSDLEIVGQDSPVPQIQTQASPPPWATLSSSPLSIVSKPSQKTAKARSMATCLSESSSIALWVRINSQTVRTKYMKVSPSASSLNTHHLTAKTGKWTPFRFDVIRRATPPAALAENRGSRDRFKSTSANKTDEGILRYGSIVVLVDLQTGVRSEHVKLVRVEKNEVLIGEDEGHPISELQRVGFVRVDEGKEDSEGRWYLSAPGARAGGGELLPPSTASSRRRKVPPEPEPNPEPMTDPITLESAIIPSTPEAGPSAPKKRKTKRNALALAVLAEDEEGGQLSVLSWAKAERGMKEIVTNNGKDAMVRMADVEKVEDWMCWIIGGVSSFSYTIFDALSDSADNAPSLPIAPVNPIPQVLAPPSLDSQTNTIDLILSTVLDPNSQPIEIYLGSIGPLPYSTWASTSPSQTISGADESSMLRTPAIREHVMGNGDIHDSDREVYSSFPANVQHVIAVVEMPRPEEVLRAMQSLSTGMNIEDQSKGKGIEQRGSANPDTLQDVESNSNPVNESGAILDNEATSMALASIPFDTEGNPLDLDQIDPAIREITGQPMSIDNDLTQAPDNDTYQANQPQEGEQSIYQTQPLPLPVHLNEPVQAVKSSDLLPLPILLIRKSDGLGFGTGSSVVAERMVMEDGEGVVPGSAQWGLRIVPS